MTEKPDFDPEIRPAAEAEKADAARFEGPEYREEKIARDPVHKFIKDKLGLNIKDTVSYRVVGGFKEGPGGALPDFAHFDNYHDALKFADSLPESERQRLQKVALENRWVLGEDERITTLVHPKAQRGLEGQDPERQREYSDILNFVERGNYPDEYAQAVKRGEVKEAPPRRSILETLKGLRRRETRRERRVASEKGPESIDSALSRENRDDLNSLDEESRDSARKAYKDARERWRDSAAARLAVWKDKTWNSFIAGRYERRVKGEEEAAKSAEEAVARIQKEMEIAREDDILKPDLEIKVEAERTAALSRATEHKERAAEIKAEKEGYEKMRQEIIDRIAGRWEAKIEGNKKELEARTAELEATEKDISLRRGEIQRLEKHLKEIKDKNIRRAYQERIREFKEGYRGYLREKKEVAEKISNLNNENRKLQARVDHARGKPKAEKKRERALRTGRGEAGKVEVKEEEKRPFGDYVKLWNEGHHRFGIKTEENLDEMVGPSEAVRELAKLIYKQHAQQEGTRHRKFLEQEVERFRRSLLK